MRGVYKSGSLGANITARTTNSFLYNSNTLEYIGGLFTLAAVSTKVVGLVIIIMRWLYIEVF